MYSCKLLNIGLCCGTAQSQWKPAELTVPAGYAILVPGSETMNVIHTIDPVYDENSRVLILGSFPSVKSRERGFFYGHPQNRFWRTLAAVLGEDIPETIEKKTSMLLRNHIALWDVISRCDITGSDDASIKNADSNDLSRILETARIRRIFVNGKTAERLYKKLIEPKTGISAVLLPSTSPANARWTPDMLRDAYSVILNYLGDNDD